MNAQTPEAQSETANAANPSQGLRLPEPDRDNITVLLHNLPNAPVLPWNRYDSPWESEAENGELESEAAAAGEESEESPSVLASETEDSLSADELPPEAVVPESESVSPSPSADLDPDVTLEKQFEPGFVNLVEEPAAGDWDASVMEPANPGQDGGVAEIQTENTLPQDADEDGLLSQLG